MTLFVTNENIDCKGFGITIKPEKNNEVVKQNVEFSSHYGNVGIYEERRGLGERELS